MSHISEGFRIVIGDGRSTEELVEAGVYDYAHSCLTSEHFPTRNQDTAGIREIVLIEFEKEIVAGEALQSVNHMGFERPTYEDALYFGSQYPEVQREKPISFLHYPWFGLFGRRDVLCLWCNAGHRELGLEDFDASWNTNYRFAFVRKTSKDR